jgi:hypothetical protein
MKIVLEFTHDAVKVFLSVLVVDMGWITDKVT